MLWFLRYGIIVLMIRSIIKRFMTKKVMIRMKAKWFIYTVEIGCDELTLPRR